MSMWGTLGRFTQSQVTVFRSPDLQQAMTSVEYRRVPRDIPPPSAPTKKKWPVFKRVYRRNHERSCVLFLKSCWSTSSFLEFRNRCAEALTSTKIRSFKHGPFFLGGGGYIAVLYGNSMYIFATLLASLSS